MGAEQDAERIFSLLTGECGDYSPEESQLLLSPKLAMVQTALRAVFKVDRELDVVTVFFAGHGIVRAGSFYLCVSDTSPGGLSISGISMVSLFSIINEFRPRQVNLIVDACEAGGSTFDVGNLLKPEIVGASSSPSVAFLGACAADQSARESASGGVLTNALVSYLTGEREIQTRQPFLDLIEVGAEVSRNLRLKGNGQTPVAWGLTLYGDGHFARNPHFDKDPTVRHFPLPTLPANSDVTRRIQAHSADLWEEHRVIKEEVIPARLLTLIRDISRDDPSGNTTLQLVSGLAKTLPIRAEEADDFLGRSMCLSTCAVALLPFLDTQDARSRAREFLLERSSLDRGCRKELMSRLDVNGDTLLNPSGVAGDLFYLPLRVTKLLGWIGADFLIDRILDLCTPESEYFQLIERIVATYPNSLVAVSDEQAPFLYLFLKACETCGRHDLGREILLSVYASFAERGGKVTRVGVDGATACKYLMGLTNSTPKERPLAPANPSYICPVLLLFGGKFGLGADWSLKDLDRLSIAYFLPDTFRDFALQTISRGTNHTFKIGFGIWSLSDFQREFERTLISLKIPDGDEETALSVLSAILLPNRTPLLLEDARISAQIRRKHVPRDRFVA
jgi:hypothetical protein